MGMLSGKKLNVGCPQCGNEFTVRIRGSEAHEACPACGVDVSVDAREAEQAIRKATEQALRDFARHFR